MSNEIKPETIKKTQELLGKYFKSPPLTEKLLRKPPFRFLHDIISAVIKETGFLEDLFSDEELISDNVKDKESKLAYLSKLIEVVKLCTGDNLTVRPSKIVAGQEPTKTNELLQSIGRALDKKINSKNAIEQYKKNKSKSKTDKDESKKLKKSSQSKKHSEDGNIHDKKIPRLGKDKENEKADNVLEKENKVKEDKISENPIIEQKGDKPSLSKSRRLESAKPDHENGSKTIKSARKKSISETSDSTKKVRNVKESESVKKKKPLQTLSSDCIPENEVVENKIPSPSESEKIKNSSKPLQEEQLQEEKQQVENNKESEKNEENIVDQNGSSEQTNNVKHVEISNLANNVMPKASLRPPSARPPSARPAAPKMRAKTDFIINEETISPAGNVNVIIENFDSKEDNADDMVVMEVPRDPTQMQGLDNIDSQLSQEHGHLVAQILETQKELINSDSADVLPKKVEIEWEAGSRRDREATVKEVDKLRTTIQTLTRVTNPLRKLLDFVQEDVDIMQKELRDWQFQYEEFNKELEIEQIKTEQSIEPMKKSLEELRNNIKQQLNKIGQVKMNIMKNDQKIQRLLNGNL